jgi:hypothetical protein
MSFVGRIENLRLAELLQMLSLFRKSGKLTLSRGETTGVFLFNTGKLYHAANGYSAPSIGELLLTEEVISRETLDAALATQRLAPKRKKLGTILVEMGAVTDDVLHEVLSQQLRRIASHFMTWDDGFFSFKFIEPGENFEQVVDDEEAKLNEIISIDPFILDLLTKVEDVGGAGSVRPVPRLQPELLEKDPSADVARQLLDHMIDPEATIHQTQPTDEVTEWPSDLADLRTLMTEIHLRPFASSGEIALLTLRYATQIVNRGVLFGVSEDIVSGIGQFGVGRADDDSPDVTNRIRHIQIPTSEQSVFAEVIKRKSSYHGRLEQCPWNNYLVDQIGGVVPPEVIVTPIVVNGRVAVIFYGDSLPGGHPITSTHGLELLMIEAGLAIEKNLLAEKLRKIEQRLRQGAQRLDGGVETD